MKYESYHLFVNFVFTHDKSTFEPAGEGGNKGSNLIKITIPALLLVSIEKFSNLLVIMSLI